MDRNKQTECTVETSVATDSITENETYGKILAGIGQILLQHMFLFFAPF